MALLPALAGIIASGFSWTALWLFTAWALCYCLQYSSARWVASHMNRRYLPSVAVYGLALAAIGLPFLIMHWRIIIWAPLYMVLFVLSLVSAYRHHERSLANNIVAIIAACSTLGLTYHYGVDPSNDVWPLFDLRAVYLATAFAMFQFGSVLVVKTMIRERGNRRYHLASLVWHVLMLALCSAMLVLALQASVHAIWTVWFLWAVALSLVARAAALPVIDARHGSRLKPMVTGMVELAASILSAAAILAMF